MRLAVYFVCLILGISTLVVVLSLGRVSAQGRKIQTCRLHGQLAFLASAQSWDENGSQSSGNRYIYLCMKNAGYSFSFAGRLCQPEMNGSELSNKWCYRPDGSALLTDIDIAINHGFDDWPSALWCPRMRVVTPGYCASHGWFVGQ